MCNAIWTPPRQPSHDQCHAVPISRGFRFICLRDGKRVRAFSRGGHDWSEQLPAVTNAMRALPAKSVTLDGEVVICSPDGRSEFERMRACFSRQGASEAFLYAFDVLELDGRDLRHESWARRRAAASRQGR